MGSRTGDLITGFALALLALPWVSAPAFGQVGQREETVRREEQEDYFKKWLEEDVRYIVTPEERSVFESLTTPAEKEKFIEQFWYRRDPDPRTAANEFKEEHYRRIAYANERFTSGIPGWRTDRGRIYILHGPPHEIQRHPSGGYYRRRLYEGGGRTQTFPFEIWRYRQIEGIGPNVEIEFVDPTWSGQYRLAKSPFEKDMLLHVPTVGLTLAEEFGVADRSDHPYFNPNKRDLYPLIVTRAEDNPFARYERYVEVQQAREIKFKDLQEIVRVNISYSQVPVEVGADYFRLGEERVIVPITVEFPNQELTFVEDSGLRTARMAIYGIVTSLTNHIVTEFEDEVAVSFRPEQLQRALVGESVYQKIVILGNDTRYKLDLVVKDLNSGKLGVIRRALVPPSSYREGGLAASPLVLSNNLQVYEKTPEEEQMFLLGNVRVRPSVSKAFPVGSPMAVYFQLYRVPIDQAMSAPSIEVTYRIHREGKNLVELVDLTGESIQYLSPDRLVLVKQLPAEGLEAGSYTLSVEVGDRIQNQSVHVEDGFRLIPPILTAVQR